jgi:Ca2+/Na+ antiporter
MKVGTPAQYKWLTTVIVTLFVFNVMDGILTVFWVYSARATEANPFMEDLVHRKPVLFMIVKMSLVTAGSVMLWIYRRRPFAVVMLFLMFVVYYYIILYHMSEMNIDQIRDLIKYGPPTTPPPE